MKSISKKIIFYFTTILLITCIGFGLFSYFTTRYSVINSIKQDLPTSAKEISNLVKSEMDSQYLFLEGISNMEILSDVSTDVGMKEKLKVITKLVEGKNYIQMGIMDLQGNLYKSTTYGTYGKVLNAAQRDYFKSAVAGKRGIMEPTESLDPYDNKALVVVYSVPIIRNDKVVGVLTATGQAEFFSDLTNNVKIGESGYTYIINNKSTLIAHPDAEKVSKGYNLLQENEKNKGPNEFVEEVNRIISGETSFEEYNFEGRDDYIAYTPIQDTDWIVVVAAPKSELLAVMSDIKLSLGVITIIAIIISTILAALIGKSIQKPIELATIFAEKLSNLDLTQDVDDDIKLRNDEIGKLGLAFQSLVDNMRIFVNTVQNSSDQVITSSQNLTDNSGQATVAIEEVAKMMEGIAFEATEQSEITQESANELNDLGNIMEEQKGQMKILNQSSNEVTKLVEEGLETLNNLVAKTKQSNEAVGSISNSITKSSKSSNEINLASKIISSIAERTNLLALNAAIESARAGESGRGFAVVADEIRKLAEQSSESTNIIDEMVKVLQKDSEDAIKVMEEVFKIIEEQMKYMQHTQNKFIEMNNAIKSSESAVKKLDEGIDEVYSKKDKVLVRVKGLATVAEKNAVGTEEAAASIEEQTASMELVAAQSEILSNLSRELRSIIEKFRV